MSGQWAVVGPEQRRLKEMASHAYFCLDVDQRAIVADAQELHREAFLLVQVWGYTTSEAARLLRVDQSTVSRACDGIRKKITEALHKKSSGAGSEGK